MDGFASFIVHDGLTIDVLNRRMLTIKGPVYCQGDLVIHVEKTLDINDRHQVRGRQYRYQVQFTDPPIREIFRYDNAHRYPGHPDAFHRHAFNTQTWKALFPPEHIGRENFPTLSDVINEVEQWWIAHRDDPDFFP
jgi:hypothetical protein